jgi:copper(I)-binding protein
MRKGVIKGLAAAMLLAGCQGREQAAGPSVTQARITLPAAPGVPGAGYFLLRGGSGADALVGVNSPAAERIEMHESGTDARGVTTMRPLDQVPLGEEITFSPGGKHLMVYGLDPQTPPGTAVELTFRFRTAEPVTVRAALMPAGSGAIGRHRGH